jgi:hypothetical protein
LSPPSESLSYPVVNREVEQQSSGRVMTLYKTNLPSTSQNENNLGKAAVLHFAFTLFLAGVMPNSACRLLGTAVLVSRSLGHLIMCFLPTPLAMKKSWRVHNKTNQTEKGQWYLKYMKIRWISPQNRIYFSPFVLERTTWE